MHYFCIKFAKSFCGGGCAPPQTPPLPFRPYSKFLDPPLRRTTRPISLSDEGQNEHACSIRFFSDEVFKLRRARWRRSTSTEKIGACSHGISYENNRFWKLCL